MEDSLGLSPDDLSNLDWPEITEQVMHALDAAFERRHERLLGENGSITRDLAATLSRVDRHLNLNDIYQLLVMMTQGSRTTFDRKTHRRIQERTTRLTYSFYAATFLEGINREQLVQSIQDHLLEAQKVLQRSWGLIEFSRLANSTLGEVDAQTQSILRTRLGEEQYSRLQSQTLNTLDGLAASSVVDALGQRALTEVYRQLLLSVITELWVDYLTEMEALRVSIGLEAYAQRDPLVQYKNRASALFSDLLAKMRLGVVSRMFTYRPRDLSSIQSTTSVEESQDEAIDDDNELEEPSQAAQEDSAASQQMEKETNKGKRRRRRRR